LGLAGSGSESGEGFEDGAGVAVFEFGVSSLGPGDGEVRGGTVDGFGDVREALFGVEEVDDLGGLGEVDLGEPPDPEGAVAEEDASLGLVESSAMSLAEDSLGEGGVLWTGIGGCGGFDGGGVVDRAGVSRGVPVLRARPVRAGAWGLPRS
jgi:hypothetical protein